MDILYKSIIYLSLKENLDLHNTEVYREYQCFFRPKHWNTRFTSYQSVFIMSCPIASVNVLILGKLDRN